MHLKENQIKLYGRKISINFILNLINGCIKDTALFDHIMILNSFLIEMFASNFINKPPFAFILFIVLSYFQVILGHLRLREGLEMLCLSDRFITFPHLKETNLPCECYSLFNTLMAECVCVCVHSFVQNYLYTCTFIILFKFSFIMSRSDHYTTYSLSLFLHIIFKEITK